MDRVIRLRLFGVLEHETPITATAHLRTGEVMTCSNMVTVWKPPELKPIQQTAYNFGILSILELAPSFIVANTKSAISTYQRKDAKWVPRGEFVTPGIGKFTKILLSDPHSS